MTQKEIEELVTWLMPHMPSDPPDRLKELLDKWENRQAFFDEHTIEYHDQDSPNYRNKSKGFPKHPPGTKDHTKV